MKIYKSSALKPFVADGLELGYCAHDGEVDVRLIGRGADAKKIVANAESVVREGVDF